MKDNDSTPSLDRVSLDDQSPVNKEKARGKIRRTFSVLIKDIKQSEMVPTGDGQ